jgi:hypothetical protein
MTTFDFSHFPIVVPHQPLPDEADHTTRSRILCEAVAGALKLPATLALDANESYATTSYCGTGNDGPVAEYCIRVLGFGFGKNAKKNTEYLAVSFLTRDAQGNVVGWSEDLHRLEGGREFWKAVNTGAALPKSKKSAKDCALLPFVKVAGDERPATPITAAIRALVAKVAPPSETAEEVEKVEKKPAAKSKKKPAKK